MPIQELAPVTLGEVEQDITALEDQYEITSADFLNIAENNVPDDDAAEWVYLLKQKESIQADIRSRVIPSMHAHAAVHKIVYGFTIFSRRAGEQVDERRLQYDCAA